MHLFLTNEHDITLAGVPSLFDGIFMFRCHIQQCHALTKGAALLVGLFGMGSLKRRIDLQ